MRSDSAQALGASVTDRRSVEIHFHLLPLKAREFLQDRDQCLAQGVK